MQKQICIVTGANGFIGKHLCKFLNAHDFKLRECVRKPINERTDQFAVGDLAEFNNWVQLFAGADTIIHLAAKVHDMSGGKKEDYIRQNTEVVKNLATEAKKHGIKKFIFLSSIKVNGERTFDKPFKADDVPKPEDDYGLSKKLAEDELLKLHEPGKFEVVIIRPCLIYGQGVKANFHNLINLVKKGLPLPFGAIHNKRSFVSLDNLSDFILTCMNHPKAAGQVFLVSDGQDLGLTELIKIIKKAVGSKTLLVPIPQQIIEKSLKTIGRAALANRLFGNLQVDIQKNQYLLGWTPKFRMEDSLNYLSKL